MANEAVIVELNNQNAIYFTVTNGTTIEKGTILKLTDPRTAAANDGANDIIAGIAAAEKVASDGSTKLAVYVPGQGNVFDLTTAPGAVITAGQLVATSGANLIKAAAATDNENGKIIGKALETSAATQEVIQVLV